MIICHLGLLGLLLISFHTIEFLIEWLEGGHDVLLFGIFPLRYLFQAVDTAMIGLFGFMGLKEAYEVLR